MSLKNHVQLIGNLGIDPKLVSTDPENSVMSVTMATSFKYTNKDGLKVDKVEWHNLVAFDKVAILFMNNLKKGAHIGLSGRLQTRNYTDSSNVSRYVTEIIVEELLFLDKLEKKQ
jgi:single-strand DNA-binding protein